MRSAAQRATGPWVTTRTAAIAAIREKVGDGKVLLALSGGVDSSVAAALLAEAVGNQLTCVFVDHGLMRKNEGDEVEAAFAKWDINFVRVDAEEPLPGQARRASTEPERKRKIIGEEFIRVFEEEAKKDRQGGLPGPGHHLSRRDRVRRRTTPPSSRATTTWAVCPDYVDFKEIIEPLRMLFKDEVRQLGRELGLPEYLVCRQPFPGPGLAIRIIGDMTKDKAGHPASRPTSSSGRRSPRPVWIGHLNQYFAVLTNMPLRGRHGRWPDL